MEAPRIISPEVMKLIVENLNSVVMLFDDAMHLLYINPVGEMLFGVSAPHLIGREAHELFNRAKLVQALGEALDSAHPFTERECEIEVNIEKVVNVDLTAIPLLEAEQPRALLVEMNPIDRQLRIAREENLLALNQATRSLVRNMAHEIKNPLGGIRGTAQLLERELVGEELKEFTGIIISEADRLQKLVDRMLGPNTLPHKEMLNIHEVLERVKQVVEMNLAEGISIGRDYDISLPELYADKDQLIQSFMNLVRNAVQALNGDGMITLCTRVLRQYTIGHVRHRHVAAIQIIDNGPGIPESLQEKIFFPMVTGHTGGTGLGLSISQSLINQHGGLIECSSQPGRTVFSVLLPISEENGDFHG
ncbi:MAG: nitrogen regulation protein NR(II) [Gammaproteobacteria bacterium]|nr:nitrogen regulation protein NR(II) [Gammaproteobacteria bacterium]